MAAVRSSGVRGAAAEVVEGTSAEGTSAGVGWRTQYLRVGWRRWQCL